MNTSAIVRTCQKTNTWLNELAGELEWDEGEMVYHALRAVLHQLRDRLPLNESVHFANQLPMLIRGCYYEGWRPAANPDHVHAEAFLAHIGFAFPGDYTIDPERITRAVFSVIRHHVSAGEIEDVKACLPSDLRDLWP